METFGLSNEEHVMSSLREMVAIFDNEKMSDMINLRKEGKLLGVFWYQRVTDLIKSRELFYRENYKNFVWFDELNVDLIGKLCKLDKDGYVVFTKEEIPVVESILQWLLNLNIGRLEGCEEANFNKDLSDWELRDIESTLRQLEVLKSRYFCFDYYCNSEDYERGFVTFTKGGIAQLTVDLKIMKDGNNEVD